MISKSQICDQYGDLAEKYDDYSELAAKYADFDESDEEKT